MSIVAEHTVAPAIDLKRLNLWMYIKQVYHISVSYSDSGWRVTRGHETFEQGNYGAGIAKQRVSAYQDPKRLSTNVLAVLEILHNLLYMERRTDALLSEKMGTMKVTHRRRARNA